MSNAIKFSSIKEEEFHASIPSIIKRIAIFGEILISFVFSLLYSIKNIPNNLETKPIQIDYDFVYT